MTAPAFPNIPSKPKSDGAAKSGSQRDRRFTDTFYDTYRHPRFPQGRPFTGQREFQSGSETESIAAGFLQSDLQCGAYYCDNPEMGQTPQERQMTLASAWVAPWLPPGGKKYMEFNYRRKIITFRYDAFVVDERNAYSQFWEACALAAGQGETVDPKQPAALAFRLRKVFGNPATFTNKIRLAQAAIAGEPWLMGAVDEPNEELAKILGYDVQYFGQLRGDAEYIPIPQQAPAEPLLTPQQVIGVPMDQVQAMIEAALAARDAQDAAKKEKQRAQMAKARAAKKPAGASV